MRSSGASRWCSHDASFSFCVSHSRSRFPNIQSMKRDYSKKCQENKSQHGDSHPQKILNLTVKRHHFTFLHISEGLTAEVVADGKMLLLFWYIKEEIFALQITFPPPPVFLLFQQTLQHKVTPGKCIWPSRISWKDTFIWVMPRSYFM